MKTKATKFEKAQKVLDTRLATFDKKFDPNEEKNEECLEAILQIRFLAQAIKSFAQEFYKEVKRK